MFTTVNTDAKPDSAETIARYKKFYKWQALLCFMHYAGAALLLGAVLKDGDWKIPVVLRYNVWKSRSPDVEGCSEGCRIYEYERVFSTISVGICVSFFSFISGTHHLIAAFPRFGLIRSINANGGVNVVRWIDYGLSASLMLMVNSILWLAPPTLHQLLHTAGLMGAVVAAGYGSEAAWAAGSEGHPTYIFCAACIPFAMSWISTFLQYSAAHKGPMTGDYSLRGNRRAVIDDDAADPPLFVTIILVILAASYCLFPIAHARRLLNAAKSPKSDPILMESVYGSLSFLAKFPLLAVYGTAVLTRAAAIDLASADTSDEPKTVSDDADTKVYIALGVSSAFSIVLAFVMYWSMRTPHSTSDDTPDKTPDISSSSKNAQSMM